MTRYPTRLDDRYVGVMLGLACDDAVGASTGFLERGTFEPVTDMVGGGAHHLEPGQWTGDTSMAMCLAESLIACEVFDPVDQMSRCLGWYRQGYWSARPHCFDIGPTTEHAIREFEKTRHPWCGPPHPITAGNGSVMRLGPVVLRCFPSENEVLHCAGESSRTTLGAAWAVEGCRLLAGALCARHACGLFANDCVPAGSPNCTSSERAGGPGSAPWMPTDGPGWKMSPLPQPHARPT